MLDLTDRHFRCLLRQITRRTLLYSEMLTAAAVVHGDAERLLAKSPVEDPVVLQLGGDDPDLLARAAALGHAYGYAEIDLNVGCPSERVTSGNFGACLMKDPALVAEGVAALRAAVPVPVTVKHRIGVDDRDSFPELLEFVDTVAAAGADRFVVHARKAWLKGLSPKENRTVPPLRYDVVYRLKAERPELLVELNGGIPDLEAAVAHLARVDGVMLGRAVYEDPFVLAGADELLRSPGAPRRDWRAAADELMGGRPPLTRRSVVEAVYPYVEEQLLAGMPLAAMSRHMLALFRSQPGGRAWRRMISERSHRRGAGVEVLRAALAALPEGVADAPVACSATSGADRPTTAAGRLAPHAT
ncbi:MAG: tRNA dihydrouridine(20/20a) synthase DusA [Trueperaceae bacterium]|nr:tRNA dihydrouridine(20/20a) synthase DusA [Trueperaceae bacterium]MCO5174159.1 tRNA dihydrouridine(20/20a) synthase DusA [Trueperaceae bacterium]MCW5820374.1 tRNA dihydrouridine(20/20a) synthase DusA [Trueperaceae bacterium]